MARNKPAPLKRRLIKGGRRTSRAPVWVMVKSRGRIRSSRKQRNWRRQKLKP